MVNNTMSAPNHVAIIMDGNGRWAKARHLPRTAGHREGVKTIKTVIRAAGEAGIKNITFFGFSTENWKRPADEVNELMGLLRMYLKAETKNFHKEDIKLRIIGFREDLPSDIVTLMDDAEKLTENNTTLTVTMAINYGGQDDIVQAAAKLAAEGVELGRDESSRELFEQNLMTGDLPPVDLMIRTSGEQRISNFLLWQSAYAELYFTDTLWPDFDADELNKAVSSYTRRDRRYGGLTLVKKEEKA